MSSRVYATGHIKDPVPLIETSSASCLGGICKVGRRGGGSWMIVLALTKAPWVTRGKRN